MTAQDFIFKAPTYRKIEGEEFKELYKELSEDNLSVNGYNPLKCVETTYHLVSAAINLSRSVYDRSSLLPVNQKVRILSFRCGRFNDILTLVVYSDWENGYLIKIGTFPSLRDFHKDDIKKYRSILTDQQQTELITAIVIANNGVGIGSYVYLRRVFESIVFDEAKRAISDGVITEEEFNKKRMDEKIIAIKDYLPAFLYNHHSELYGVLSLGIHQLKEDVCLGFFPVLYDCIILILDDRLAQKEKEMTTKKAAASLSSISTYIKK
jgi:hypothetical protein